MILHHYPVKGYSSTLCTISYSSHPNRLYKPKTQAFDFLSPNMNERWLPSSQEKWAAADNEQFGRSHTKCNLCSTRCYIRIIITEIILLINLEQHLSAGHNCPYLDASQECTWQLSMEAVNFIRWWGQPVLQHGSPEIGNTMCDIVRSKVVAAWFWEWHANNEGCLDMSVQHDFWFLTSKESKSAGHLYDTSPILVCTGNNLRDNTINQTRTTSNRYARILIMDSVTQGCMGCHYVPCVGNHLQSALGNHELHRSQSDWISL